MSLSSSNKNKGLDKRDGSKQIMSSASMNPKQILEKSGSSRVMRSQNSALDTIKIKNSVNLGNNGNTRAMTTPFKSRNPLKQLKEQKSTKNSLEQVRNS